MLDTVIGPITNVINSSTFEMNVTHIGRHNQFRYYDYERITVANNNTNRSLNQLYGMRVRCLVRYRDTYNQLYADIELE